MPTKTTFSNGDPVNQIRGTRVTAEHCNGWQSHVHDGADADGHAPKILPAHIDGSIDADTLDGKHFYEIAFRGCLFYANYYYGSGFSSPQFKFNTANSGIVPYTVPGSNLMGATIPAGTSLVRVTGYLRDAGDVLSDGPLIIKIRHIVFPSGGELWQQHVSSTNPNNYMHGWSFALPVMPCAPGDQFEIELAPVSCFEGIVYMGLELIA